MWDLSSAIVNRSTVRITDYSGHAVGLTGILLGYNAMYDSVKVGFVDQAGEYTGEYTKVSRKAVEPI